MIPYYSCITKPLIVIVIHALGSKIYLIEFKKIVSTDLKHYDHILITHLHTKHDKLLRSFMTLIFTLQLRVRNLVFFI